eukprot:Hpha_TRINITY_DN1544_c0_g1::TRINITY_DN1544_c0_g1_i1::g.57141::m.57141/K16186/RRAGC_D; Ras-related GTP-binding protein C/D
MDDYYRQPRAGDDDMDDLDDDEQPRILLMGLRKSGKTSIQKVVFEKMSPHNTMFFETTTKLARNTVSTIGFVRFQVLDFPGQLMDLMHSGGDDIDTNISDALSGPGAVVFVIDCNSIEWPPVDAVRNLVQIMLRVIETPGPAPNRFEVFIHKVDCVQQEQPKDRLISLKLAMEEELNFAIKEKLEKGQDPTGKLAQVRGHVRNFMAANVTYHLTSIYDRSVFDAFSKVVQRVMDTLCKCLRNLLDTLVTQNTADRDGDGARGIQKAYLFDVQSKIYIAQDSNQGQEQIYKMCFDLIDVTVDITQIYGAQRPALADRTEEECSLDDDEEEAARYGNDSLITHDEQMAATVRLESKQVLYMRQVSEHLALVCVVQEDTFRRAGLLNYNVQQFKRLVNDLFRAHRNAQLRRAQLRQARHGGAPAIMS